MKFHRRTKLKGIDPCTLPVPTIYKFVEFHTNSVRPSTMQIYTSNIKRSGSLGLDAISVERDNCPNEVGGSRD